MKATIRRNPLTTGEYIELHTDDGYTVRLRTIDEDISLLGIVKPEYEDNFVMSLFSLMDMPYWDKRGDYITLLDY